MVLVLALPCRWSTFARKLLFAELASYMLWLISFMVFALSFQVGVAAVAADIADPALSVQPLQLDTPGHTWHPLHQLHSLVCMATMPSTATHSCIQPAILAGVALAHNQCCPRSQPHPWSSMVQQQGIAAKPQLSPAPCCALPSWQDEDTSMSLPELLSTHGGCTTVVANLLALLGMAPFLIIEGATVYAYGTGWISAWNMLDLAMYSAQVSVVQAAGQWHA
jgi:hypothetical protein